METHKLQDLSLEQRDDKQNERKRRHQQLKMILQQQMEEFNQLEEQVCHKYIHLIRNKFTFRQKFSNKKKNIGIRNNSD